MAPQLDPPDTDAPQVDSSEEVETLIAEARRLDANDDARALAVAEHALARAAGAGAGLRAAAGDCLALCQLHQGVFDGALENIYRSIGLWRSLADRAGESASRTLHAQLLMELGQMDEALDEGLLALRLADAAADERGRAGTCMVVGFVYRALGRWGDARGFFERAMALAESVGDRWLLARALCNIGNIHNDIAALRRKEGRQDVAQDLQRALDLYERSRQLFAELGDARLEGNVLRNIALCHSDLGDVEAAVGILATQLARARAMGNPLSEEMAARLLGKAHLERGGFDEAARWLRHAIELAIATRRVECEWLSHEMLSRACEEQGDAVSALRHFKRFHQLHAQVVSERNERRGRALALQYESEKARAEAETQRLRAAMLERTNLELAQEAQRLSRASFEDPLTGLYNRRRLEAAIQEDLARRGPTQPYSMALVDIDFFKRVNDTFSHQTGDEVLREVGGVLRASCRQGDLAIRYGGEEFSLVLLNVTAVQARGVCERIRLAVQEHPWSALNPALAVTVSIGIADNGEAPTPHAMLALADKRLYGAKHGGRNQVVAEGFDATP